MSSDFIPPRHTEFSYQIDYVGNEKNPVLIVDNFLDKAELLIDIAERYCHFQDPAYYYPGMQAMVPPFYKAAIYTYLGDIICNTFSLSLDDVSHTNSLFAMVLTQPEKLLPSQSRPHSDCGTPLQLAAVHYLCNTEHGGTSLYRHKATGFEAVNETKSRILDKYILTEEKDISWQRKYINGSDKYYDQIASYDAKFNRIVIYHGNCLHSGNIAANFSFNPHPRLGRLTLTSFINSRD